MRLAVLMPTRNRARTAHRALESFLAALESVDAVNRVSIVVVDDSDDAAERAELCARLAGTRDRYPAIAITVLAPDGPVAGAERSIARPGGGPGAARNHGLRFLRARPCEHDRLIMFDDDIVFGSIDYRGHRLACRGDIVLQQALDICRAPRTVAGCAYLGRQDLSILEHIRLHGDAARGDNSVPPALDRLDIDNVAPAGISTAFLAIAASAHALPDFPEHYNEDYVWLHALERAGWTLNCIAEPLAHAPPGGVAITAPSLSFEIFGEIVWLAVLERDRFSVDDPDAMAAAIDEIVGDLRSARIHLLDNDGSVFMIMQTVMGHYLRVRTAIENRQTDPAAVALLDAIRAGLAL